MTAEQQAGDAAAPAASRSVVLAPAGAPALPCLPPTILAGRTLRFRIETDRAGSLLSAPILSETARNGGVVRRLETGYFDTQDRFLFGNGLSLRVRRHGRRHVQRLALHDRTGRAAPMIWEWPVADAAPDLSCLSADRIIGLRKPLADRLAGAAVGPVFETRLRRRIRRLELPDAVLDLVLDEGTVQAGGRVEALHEVGLVLRAGDSGPLYDLAARLLETGSLHLNPQGIVRRGYALASGGAMRALKAQPHAVPAALAVTLPTDDMIAAILQDCQTHLLANQPIAAEGRNPDGVHQMRVALRRLRSALSLYRREVAAPAMRQFAAEAKWAADELGDARAWDVLLSSTIRQPSRLNRSGADFDQLREAAERPRAEAYERVRRMLDARRYDRFLLSLGQWTARRGWRNEVDHAGLAALSDPAIDMAGRILARLHAQALKRGKGFSRLTPEHRHELRIVLKKLRYAAEFFLPLYGDGATARRFLRHLARLQEALGLEQDAATTQPLLDTLAAAGTAPGLHQAIGVIAGWQSRAHLTDRAALAGPWRRFKTLPVFWPPVAEAARD